MPVISSTHIYITTNVTISRVHDIISNGLDNNAFNYWGKIVWSKSVEPPVDVDHFPWLSPGERAFYKEHKVTMHSFAPLNKGWLAIKELEGGKTHKLDLEAVCRGLQLMAEKYRGHFADLINENDDIETADVFFQLALLGDLVYG